MRSWDFALTLFLSVALFSCAAERGGAAPPAPALLMAPDPPPCIDLLVLVAAAEADRRLRDTETCDRNDLGKLLTAVRMLDACAGDVTIGQRWAFPVADILPADSIGGHGGNSYQGAAFIPCYATKYPGHPAHDLFVNDPRQVCRNASGRPFVALAVEDGLVLVAHDGWRPGDEQQSGNYLLLYLPGRKQIAYYAHLETVLVKPGKRVAAGAIVGTIGRTGKSASERRSQTHLHFGLWDAATFQPINSFRLLRSARSVPMKNAEDVGKAALAGQRP